MNASKPTPVASGDAKVSQVGYVTGPTASVATQFLGVVVPPTTGAKMPMPKNLVLIITDQERIPMWFPSGWEENNLVSTARLKRNGLTFTRAFTAAAMCTPARNTLFTGLFPAQHQSMDTLTEGMAQSDVEHQLDPTLPNLATCLKEVGYEVVYKGKWHMSKGVTGADGRDIYDDLTRYGFDGWDAPDAGGDTAPGNFGGGTANNDQRFVDDAVAYVKNKLAQPASKPFCLIMSLVNPHDVLSYPNGYSDGGYPDDPWLTPTNPPIEVPPTESEDLALNAKPTAHRQLLTKLQLGLGPLLTTANKTNYLTFYGNLMVHVDEQIGQLLAAFDDGGSDAGTQLLNETVIIRTADHGEMGLCHGGLRQKSFVTYEETLRIPLIWSNPVLFPEATTTTAMVSHVDFLPTLCSLTGVPNWQSKGFQGVDYSSIILNPSAPGVQDYILFTFDDIYSGFDQATYPDGVVNPPNRIQAIRTAEYKYAWYYDPSGANPDQEEFYDLRPTGGDYDATYNLPLELKNLSEWAENKRTSPIGLTPDQEAARTKLEADLAVAAAARLQPRPPGAIVPPTNITIDVVNWTDDTEVSHTNVEVQFISRSGEQYQIQQSTDLVNWSNLGPVLIGNNGPILESFGLPGERAYYRIQYGPVTAE
ncbi:MAG TPA: sulfatase-like hydrolase/transferase [Candidatus Limnocylindria bacterium]|jgi:arylsulfatase A-like enzyme|nr:sulfatase-like hydrolase/transferase [Candidatus Limnocylindria bacterium]